MKFHLLLASTCLLACAFAAPVEQPVVFDEDCVEELSEPLEIDSESIQMPEIEPAIAAPDEFLMYEDIVDDENADCEEELVPTEPQPIEYNEPEDDYECEEEEAGQDFEQEMDYDSNAFAYDEGSLIVSNDVDEIVDEECEEVTAEAVVAEDDYFGFNIEAGNVEEAEELVMKPIEEENFAGEIEECEE